MDRRKLEQLEKTAEAVKEHRHWRLYMDSLNEDGGPGSGNWGHRGRPGVRGGSMPGSSGGGGRVALSNGKFRSSASQARLEKKLKDTSKTLRDMQKEIAVDVFFQATRDAVREHRKSLETWKRKRETAEYQLKTYKETRRGPETEDTKRTRILLESQLEDARLWEQAAERSLKETLETSGAKEMLEKTARLNEAAKARNEAALEAFPSAADCRTAEQVEAWIGAKGFFKNDGDEEYETAGRVSMTGMTDAAAVKCGEYMDRLFSELPWAAGKLPGVRTAELSGDGAAGTTDGGTGIVTLNTNFFGPGKNGEEKYRKAAEEDGLPPGTDLAGTVVHELTRSLESRMNSGPYSDTVSDLVMEQVQKKLYGSYRDDVEDQVRAMISSRAAGSTDEGEVFGRNTEFLAEAVQEALCSAEPRDIAQTVLGVFRKVGKINI